MAILTARFFAVVGVILAGVLIIFAHRRRPELRASETALSAYFTHPTRAIMAFAYAAIAAALLSTAFILSREMNAPAAVAAAACCVGAMLLVPVVATTSRSPLATRTEMTKRAHRYAAAGAFVAVGVAMAVSACTAIADANALVAVLGFFGAVLVIRVIHGNSGAKHGLWQKLLLVILGLWIMASALTS